MSRVNFAVEQGFDIDAINGAVLVSQLAGAAAPGGDAGPQDAAPIGSTYQRTDGGFYVKTANVGATSDWALFAFVLSGGYAPVNGDPTAGDTFEEAIAKLDGNQDDIQTSLGIAQGDVDFGTFTGAVIEDNRTAKEALQDLEDSLEALVTLSGVALDATDLGTFTGSIIVDNRTIKEAFQDLETYVESISGGTTAEETGITTATVVDSVLVDDHDSVEWEVVIFEEATPANKKFLKVTALHDGTASADATEVDDTVHTKLKVGSNFNAEVAVILSGAGGAQEMQLEVTSSTAGVTARARRTTAI